MQRPLAGGNRSGAARAPLAAPSPHGHHPGALQRAEPRIDRTRATAGTPRPAQPRASRAAGRASPPRDAAAPPAPPPALTAPGNAVPAPAGAEGDNRRAAPGGTCLPDPARAPAAALHRSPRSSQGAMPRWGGQAAESGVALTEWLTPHMRTLSSGSLARNNFTFCATKCFFLVLVLLAMTGTMLLGAAMAQPAVEAGAGERRKAAGEQCRGSSAPQPRGQAAGGGRAAAGRRAHPGLPAGAAR